MSVVSGSAAAGLRRATIVDHRGLRRRPLVVAATSNLRASRHGHLLATGLSRAISSSTSAWRNQLADPVRFLAYWVSSLTYMSAGLWLAHLGGNTSVFRCDISVRRARLTEALRGVNTSLPRCE